MKAITVLLMTSTLWNAAAQDKPKEVLLVHDPLASRELVSGEANKAHRGGEYTPGGWRALANGDYLMIELQASTGFEGKLEVDLTDLDWIAANTHVSKDKIHFLNMASSPRADHHVEHGGTNRDALWTLRAGKAPDGGPAYGNRFAVLWASRGAKRADPSDYEESVAPMASGWKWDKERYTFTVTWSKRKGELLGFINGQMVFHEPWVNQVQPLQYVYLAKGPEFHTFVGPRYSNLKVYRLEYKDASTNQNPVVSIVLPRTGTVLPAPGPLEIQVEASDDGSIATVELLDAGPAPRSMGLKTARPFRFELPKLATGWYVFTARATDNAGLKSDSRPVYVTVGLPWKAWGLENRSGNSGGGSRVFVEEKGLVLMEAESVPPANGWQMLRRAGGYTGSGYLEWTLPEQGKTPGSGVMAYDFRIETPGKYQILWRSRLQDPSNRPETLDPDGNDTWLRFRSGASVPGQAEVEGWKKIAILGHPQGWTWNTNADQGAPHPLTPVCRTYTKGVHRIEISGRSAGHAIDRIVLRRYEAQPSTTLSPQEERALASLPSSRRE